MDPSYLFTKPGEIGNMDSIIKMIGLDLDGTTLNENSEFSERTIDVLKRTIDKGIEVIIATGRAENSLPNTIYKIPGLNYVATSNGARVIDIVNNNVIYENFIDKSCIDEIHALLKERDANIEVFIDGKAYIGKREYDSIMSGENKLRRRDYIKETRIPIEDIFSLLYQNSDRVENINVNYTSFEEKAVMEPELKKIKGVHLTSSVPMNNELGGLTTSKADALRFLMEKFSLSPNNIMACGDNPNDLEMINFAGIGIAMGNAEEIVKKSADFVTLSNAEDGVAFAIEKYVL